MKKKTVYYSIGQVAESYDIHQQTLRQYERHGLITPSRTEGNTRLYCDEDLEQLEIILNLTRELGVNLAGVEIVLNMRGKMEEMQRQLDALIRYLQEALAREEINIQDEDVKALVRVPTINQLIKN
ncbi:MAG: helix-turn-helix transcriptional regulator [Holophagales bacterium]|nr:helix-turn-helix transcriptional regulator [Holophagales bacterium]